MNEIQLYSKLNDPLDAIERMGEFFAKSGMFGCDRAEQGRVLAMVCMSEGISPVQLLRTWHLVDGQLSKKALAALAEFRKMGGRHKWLKTGDEIAKTEDEREAVGQFTSPDGETLTVSFSINQAKNQGLSFKPNSAWMKTPANMLRARVITNAIGMLAPEIFAGDASDSEASMPAPEPLLKTVVSEPEPEPEPKQKKVKQAEPEPKAPAAPEPPTPPATAEAKPIKAEKNDKGLTPETQVAIAEVIESNGGNMDEAFAFLLKKKWIETHLRDLSVPRAEKILNKPQGFINLVKSEGGQGQ